MMSGWSIRDDGRFGNLQSRRLNLNLVGVALVLGAEICRDLYLALHWLVLDRLDLGTARLSAHMVDNHAHDKETKEYDHERVDGHNCIIFCCLDLLLLVILMIIEFIRWSL